MLSLLQVQPLEAGGPGLTRYLVVCGLLIGLTAGLAWVLRRFVAGAVRGRAAQRSLQMLDVLPLGGKQRLGVVRCYDRSFVIGLGEKEMCLIAELDAPAAPAPEPAPAPERERFPAALIRATEPGPAPQTRAPSRARPASVKALLEEGLLG